MGGGRVMTIYKISKLLKTGEESPTEQ